MQSIINRLVTIATLAALMGPSVEVTGADQPPLTIEVQKSHLGFSFIGAGGTKYFVTEIVLTNHTGRNVTVPLSSIKLYVDGVPFTSDHQLKKLKGYDFRIGRTTHRFRDLNVPETLPLSNGTTGSAWLVYNQLPRTADVPHLELRFNMDEQPFSFDITGHYTAKLALSLERIGPRDALGLLTINGSLNTISVGTFVDTLDQLAASGLSRIVVTFGDDASEIDEPLGNWLRQTAEGVQTSRTYAMFPAVVSTIQEFHVADLPGRKSNGRPSSHIHTATASAVEEALASAYNGLPTEEIVAEIEQGHPLAQAAALVSAGPSLPQRHLPLLLKRSHADDALLQRAGLIALGGFGDPAAIERLTQQARSKEQQSATLAIECLAASRFPAAHDALADLLSESLAVPPIELVRILARYPRPRWSNVLANMATESSSANHAVRREVIQAIAKIGHPNLRDILKQALESSDANLRQAAFRLLVIPADGRFHDIAMNYALGYIQESPPTPQMLSLFERHRDPRATPLLLAHLDDPKANRSQILNTLAQIGPSNIDRKLAAKFDRLKHSEQSVVLDILAKLRSPELLPLAKSALASEHESLFKKAAHALKLLGNEPSIALLSAALQKTKTVSRIETLASELESIGTPQSINRLETLRNSSTGDKRSVIVKALQTHRRKSPGGLHLNRAERYAMEEKWEPAIAEYSFALDRDPDLATAFAGRGHCRLKLNDVEQAAADFRKGVELDPDDGLAVTGLSITLAIAGKIDEAVSTMTDAEDRFKDDNLFAYNAACAYGRLVEAIDQQTPTTESKARRQQFESAALDALERSVKLGFDQLDFMQNDPDLNSLHGIDRFKKLAGHDATENEETENEDKKKSSPDESPRTIEPSDPGEQ